MGPPTESIESMLSGGHPNSLGRTVEVVELVMDDRDRLDELYRCYFCDDEVVRLRTSSALKRVAQQEAEALVPYLDGLLSEIAAIDQASTQWTLAQLYELLDRFMSSSQRKQALTIMKRNLADHDDWIVLNTTMAVLHSRARQDAALKKWLRPHLSRLSNDRRKAVAGRATRLLAQLN